MRSPVPWAGVYQPPWQVYPDLRSYPRPPTVSVTEAANGTRHKGAGHPEGCDEQHRRQGKSNPKNPKKQDHKQPPRDRRRTLTRNDFQGYSGPVIQHTAEKKEDRTHFLCSLLPGLWT